MLGICALGLAGHLKVAFPLPLAHTHTYCSSPLFFYFSLKPSPVKQIAGTGMCSLG